MSVEDRDVFYEQPNKEQKKTSFLDRIKKTARIIRNACVFDKSNK